MPFCRYCGAKLEEGQVCSCQHNQVQQPYEMGQPQQQPYEAGQPQQNLGGNGFSQSQQAQQVAAAGRQARDNAVHAAKSLMPFFQRYATNPVEAVGSAVAEKNLHLAIAMAVIRVLAVCILISRVVGSFAGLIRTATGAVSGLSSLMGEATMAVSVSGNLGGCILWGVISGVVTLALSTLVVFAMGRLVKVPVSILQAFVGTSVNGGVASVFILLAALCSLFSMGLAVGCLVAAVLSAAVFGVLTMRAVCGEHQTLAFWGGYLLLTLVMLVIGWYVISNCFFAALGGVSMTYAGEKITIKGIVDQFKAQFGDLDTFLQSMLSQMSGGLF